MSWQRAFVATAQHDVAGWVRRADRLSGELAVLLVHRLLGDAEHRADLGPREAVDASSSYGDGLGCGQLVLGARDAHELFQGVFLPRVLGVDGGPHASTVVDITPIVNRC